MKIYFFIYLYISVIAALSTKQIKKNYFAYGSVFILPAFLILFVGFRPGIGYDYQQYEFLYGVPSFAHRALLGIEPGFNFLISQSKYFGISFQHFLVLVAIISLSIKISVLYNYSPYFFLSLLLYFVQEMLARDMSNIRQGLAIAVFFYLAMNFYRISWVKIVILSFLAVMFHFTALIGLVGLLVCRFTYSTKLLLCCILLSGFVSTFLTAEKVELIAGMIGWEYLITKVNDYSMRSEYSSALGVTPGLILRILIVSTFVCVSSSWFSKRDYNLLRNLSVFGLCWFLAFNQFEVIAVRGSLYFRILDTVIIPSIMYAVIPKQRVIVYFFVLVYALQGLIRELFRHGVYFPYNFGSL